MLKSYNRDIIMVSSRALHSEEAFNHEVEVLKELLYTVEDMYNIAACTEIFDLNRYRVDRKTENIVRLLCEKQLRPFIFISNRN